MKRLQFSLVRNFSHPSRFFHSNYVVFNQFKRLSKAEKEAIEKKSQEETSKMESQMQLKKIEPFKTDITINDFTDDVIKKMAQPQLQLGPIEQVLHQLNSRNSDLLQQFTQPKKAIFSTHDRTNALLQLGIPTENTEAMRQLKNEVDAAKKDIGSVKDLENRPQFHTEEIQPFKSTSDESFERLEHKVKPLDLRIQLQYPEGVEVSETGFTSTGLSFEDFMIKRRDFGKNKFKEAPLPQYEFLYAADAPTSIKTADVGKMSLMPNEDYEKYFSTSGLGGQLDKNFNLAAHRALLIREPVIPIVNEMKKMKENVGTNQRGYVLVGERGSGKSAVLTTAMHYAFKNNFIVVNIPDASYWTHGIHYIEPSVLLKGYFDAPVPTAKFLKAFHLANEEVLRTIPLSKNYDLPVEAGQKAPTNLSELAIYGLSADSNLAVAFKLVLDELLNNTTTPILFAVDDYNFFLDDTFYKFGNLSEFETTRPKVVHASEYVLVRAINKAILNNRPNHLVVGAYTNYKKTKHPLPYKKNVLTPVNVPRFSKTELKVITEYYQSIHFAYVDDPKMLDQLVFLTGAIPANVFQEYAYL